jgi:pSer/pThr/pTyr-binding forkhead associated (FHA) protein
MRNNTANHSMVQLNILSGEYERQFVKSNTFPIRIGRGENCQLQLVDTGIWENHLELNLNEEQHFTIRTASDATAMVNGKPLKGVQLLRNGDLIEIGLVKIQFWLGTVQQKNLGIREAAVWALLLAVTMAEIYLLFWLG